MKIKTKSIKKVTSIALNQAVVETLVEEWNRYIQNPNSVFSAVFEEDGNVVEFVLEEDQ